MNSDEKFMREALHEAQRAFALGEVPVGAILVVNNEIIARAHNRVEMTRDPTEHAEMIALREGAKILNNWRLLPATLYCTLEPCPMCAGAMIHSRLPTLVWGARDLRSGAHGSWIDMSAMKHPIHELTVRKGILEDEARLLMRQFFKMRRKKGVGKNF